MAKQIRKPKIDKEENIINTKSSTLTPRQTLIQKLSWIQYLTNREKNTDSEVEELLRILGSRGNG